MKKNVVYYTVVNKNKLNFTLNYKSNERLETIQAKYVLRSMLNYLKIEYSDIYKTKLGKPYFKNTNVFFNYSHSNNFIACAISKYSVGIDIEESDRVINEAMIKTCNLTHNNKFEELVKREALSKLTGDGIAIVFNKNNFDNINKKNIVINDKKYICAIYSNCTNASFKFIDIK